MSIKEIFDDQHGRLSSMRIMSFIALIVAIVYTFTTKDLQWEILSMWIISAFMPKALQKMAELKYDKNLPKN